MQTITMTPARKTVTAWEAAHSALCAGKWVLARLYLDDLISAPEADRASLCTLDSYERVAKSTVPSSLRPILEDRLTAYEAAQAADWGQTLETWRRR